MKKSKKRLPDCRFVRADKTNLEGRDMEEGQTNQGEKTKEQTGISMRLFHALGRPWQAVSRPRVCTRVESMD